MAGTYSWQRGNDGTEYYINSANGVVAGMVQSAGNGADIFKIGFGVDFIKFYHQNANAKAAVEKTAPLKVAASQQLKGRTTVTARKIKTPKKPTKRSK